MVSYGDARSGRVKVITTSHCQAGEAVYANVFAGVNAPWTPDGFLSGESKAAFNLEAESACESEASGLNKFSDEPLCAPEADAVRVTDDEVRAIFAQQCGFTTPSAAEEAFEANARRLFLPDLVEGAVPSRSGEPRPVDGMYGGTIVREPRRLPDIGPGISLIMEAKLARTYAFNNSGDDAEAEDHIDALRASVEARDRPDRKYVGMAPYVGITTARRGRLSRSADRNIVRYAQTRGIPVYDGRLWRSTSGRYFVSAELVTRARTAGRGLQGRVVVPPPQRWPFYPPLVPRRLSPTFSFECVTTLREEDSEHEMLTTHPAQSDGR